MLFGEGPARSRLEIALKSDRTLAVGERNGSLDAPGTEFCGVRNFTGVMASEPVTKVIGYP